MKLNITYTSDEHECDDCGSSYAQGAIVRLDDHAEPFLELIPVAHCFGGTHYEDENIYKDILMKLGYEVEVGYE